MPDEDYEGVDPIDATSVLGLSRPDYDARKEEWWKDLNANFTEIDIWARENSSRTVPKTRHIDDYGADPSGVFASDEALEGMIAESNPGERLALTDGDYRLDGYHDIPHAVVVDGTGGTIVATEYNGDKSTFDQGAMFATEEAVLSFAGTQTATETTLAGAHRRTDDRITVSDPAGFSEGDDLLIRQPGGAILSRSYQPTRTVISAIDGSDLYLQHPLQYSHPDSSEVIKLDPVVGGTFKNLTFEGGDPGNCLSSRYSRGIGYHNCVVDGYLQHAFQVWDDLGSVMVDCEAVNALERSGSHGEAFRVCGSSDIMLDRPRVSEARRGLDLRSGCSVLRIRDPDVSRCSLHGFSFHNSGDDEVYGAVDIRGGTIAGHSITDDTLDDGEAGLGYGISTSANATFICLDGVTASSRRLALYADGARITASNCRFRSTWQTSTIYPTVGITGEDVTLRDCVIETYGSRGTALDVMGDDVVASGIEIRPGQGPDGVWSEHPVHIEGAGTVELDFEEIDWEEGGVIPAIEIDGVDSLTLSGNIEGLSGSEVTAIATGAGTITRLMLDDLRSSSAIDLTTAGPIGDLWVGAVDAPTFDFDSGSTVHDAYGVTE